MKLEELKRRIAELPEDAEIAICRTVPNLGRTVQGWGNDGSFTVLQALASSHDELLVALKDELERDGNDCFVFDGKCRVHGESHAAIERAEK